LDRATFETIRLDTSNPLRAWKKAVQFILIRAFDEVREEKDQVIERELFFFE